MTIDKIVRDSLQQNDHKGSSSFLKISSKAPDYFCILIVLTALALSLFGLKSVPFHPDEATQIYMSSDLETLFRDPFSMAWQTGSSSDHRMILRLLDAPVARYLIGLGRMVSTQEPIQVDWRWDQTWNYNLSAGALPSADLLASGRLVPSLLFPVSLALVYSAFRRFRHPWLGVVVAILLLINPFILLHTRRAMAEAGMFFALSFFLFACSKPNINPIILGLAAGLAFNSKQSLIVLIPFGLVILFLWKSSPSQTVLRRISSCVKYLVVIVFLTFVLNPFLWKDPVRAIPAAWDARQSLLQRQVADLRRIAPDQVADSPLKSAGILLAQAYILRLAPEDADNYHQELMNSEEQYFSFAAHRWMRGLGWGGVFLILGIFGFFSWMLQKDKDSRIRNLLSSLAILSILLFISLAIAVPLPYQRYSLPVVILGCVWEAIGLSQLFRLIKLEIRKQSRLTKRKSPLLSEK